MSTGVLEQLKSEGFALSIGFLSTPNAVRRFLARRNEVLAVKEALKQGAVTEAGIRRFVSSIVQGLQVGKRLPNELALTALAVVLETRPTDFAEEFLHDLSRLELAELSLCIRVARECLRHRTTIARNKTKAFSPWKAESPVPFRLESSLGFVCKSNHIRQVTKVCEVA